MQSIANKINQPKQCEDEGINFQETNIHHYMIIPSQINNRFCDDYSCYCIARILEKSKGEYDNTNAERNENFWNEIQFLSFSRSFSLCGCKNSFSQQGILNTGGIKHPVCLSIVAIAHAIELGIFYIVFYVVRTGSDSPLRIASRISILLVSRSAICSCA